MIKQLKSNIAFVSAFTIVFVAIGSVEIFFSPAGARYNFFKWYAEFLTKVEENLVLDYALTVISIVTTGYFINRAFNKTTFYSKTTGFPIFIFTLIVSTLGGFYFETHLVVDFLFALVFLKIIELDQNKSAVHVSFLAGILLGTSFLFSFWVIPVGLVVFYSLLVFRPFQWREWLVGTIGMAMPVLYLFSIKYLLLSNYIVEPKVFKAAENESLWYDYVGYLILIAIVIIALATLLKQFKFQTNIERKQINILGFFTVISFVVSAGIYWVYRIEYFIFTVPLTLMVALPIVNMKRDKLMNFLLTALLVLNLLRIFVF